MLLLSHYYEEISLHYCWEIVLASWSLWEMRSTHSVSGGQLPLEHYCPETPSQKRSSKSREEF